MYKKLTILLLLIIFSCAGVMRTYYVKTHYDEFDNFNVYEQFYNRNKTGALWEDALNVRIIKYDDQRTKYSIIIYKENPDVWLYANQPLKIKADDDLLEFSFINEKSHILAANNVQKWGYYLADKESIYKIAKAKRVLSKVHTTKGYYEVKYTAETINRIKEFLNMHDK